MRNCPNCNFELEEYIFHEGARDEPPTTRFECLLCGDIPEEFSKLQTMGARLEDLKKCQKQ